MNPTRVLQARAVSVDAPGGRPLFHDLGMTLTTGERVAVVGRNGVGKSTLLDVLAGNLAPGKGLVVCNGRRCLVPQDLPFARGRDERQSPGEKRKRLLAQAFEARADFLLLDEPTHDLDGDGIDWLVEALTCRWSTPTARRNAMHQQDPQLFSRTLIDWAGSLA